MAADEIGIELALEIGAELVGAELVGVGSQCNKKHTVGSGNLKG